MTLEIGILIALAGIVFGWGASWATLGQSIKSLKENQEEHGRALQRLNDKLDGFNHVSVRMAVLETKVFGKPVQHVQMEAEG